MGSGFSVAIVLLLELGAMKQVRISDASWNPR
ncbi:Hypothetical protein CpCP13_1504 [Corynebacterium pseudotuberculosis]|nr:Hypothetical protein CpPAT10_1468a [Corynebacterium pseudotuberculosis PAT10]AFF22622.1 Hypothetical protein CpP54B96_1494 [Corynebacterium pseudotuberculosis P54B96]AFH52418.1 Hypothetical protein Cp267_1529 [Corynebacterium pseudotuberculosis 267]AJC14203.1 Hypothetical protein CpVD57_1498 [Corynebacterium pseudotuberculosis]AKJ56150.1 Hypothetical protein Cp12C_1547 [Corynebacterium pseudotuberculosis]